MTAPDQPPRIDLGPAVRDRELPRDVAPEFAEALIGEAQRWLGTLWLAERGGHPLRRLWRRRDWLATNELLTLGTHVRNVKAMPNADGFLREILKHVRSTDAANRTGHLWELFVASMFHGPEHPVEPAKRAQPGYDLTMRPLQGPGLRVSCKALNPSQAELEFRAFACELFESIAPLVHPERPLQFFMLLPGEWSTDQLDVSTVLAQLRTALDRAGTQTADFAIGRTYLHCRPLHSTRRFHRREVSYALTLASEYPKDEQRRFDSKLREALDNLDHHVGSCADGMANAVAMRVPLPISMSDAVAAARRLLESRYSHVACVFLYRAQLVSDGPAGASNLGHEFHTLANPYSVLGVPAVHVNIPVGTLLKTEPRNALFVGAKKLELASTYLFNRGRYCFEEDVSAAPANEYRFHIERHFTDSVSLILTKRGLAPMRVDWEGPENWLVL